MAQLSASPNNAEGVCNGWLEDKIDHNSLTRRPQILRVHKLSWKRDKSSRDWLRRLGEINLGVFSLNAESTKCAEELVNKQGASSKKETLDNSTWAVEQCPSNKINESFLPPEPIPEGSQHRKPDSTYIQSISRINLAFSEVSKKSCSHEILTASLFQPKYCKFATHLLPVNEVAFFPSEVNLQAKRKLSFEYIQDVSMLQYGHNSMENGNFRR